jgi:hypothetical protein
VKRLASKISPVVHLCSTLGMWSCGDDGGSDAGPDLGLDDGGADDASGPQLVAPAISSPEPGRSYVLVEAESEQVMEVIEWSAADLAGATPVSYRVQIDVAGDLFASPTTLGETDGLSLSVTVGFVNGLLLGRGSSADVAAALELRIVATSGGGAGLISSSVPLTVTPYDPTLPTFPPVLSSPSPGTTLSLDRDRMVSNLTTLTWSAADFGTGALARHRVELDRAGGDFSAPVWVGQAVAGGVELPVTHRHMNERIALADLPLTDPAAVRLRVVATSTDGTASLTSAPVEITVAPFSYRRLGVPGSYQGWDPANTTTVIWATENTTTFEGYIWFAQRGEYKFVDGPSWDVNYGDSGADGVLDRDGSNLINPAGFTRLGVDLVTLEHESLSISEWTVAGTAVPAGSNAEVIRDPATGLFSVTLDLVPGDLSFEGRSGGGAVVDTLGDAEADGKLEHGAPGFAITSSGTYRVTLDLRGPLYRYRIEPS